MGVRMSGGRENETLCDLGKKEKKKKKIRLEDSFFPCFRILFYSKVWSLALDKKT